ncbi:MAG: hypothetical protein HY720_16005 [Planctomycetes bacterium]|nr:hypothetical protein [Planctomycetota bacterium]
MSQPFDPAKPRPIASRKELAFLVAMVLLLLLTSSIVVSGLMGKKDDSSGKAGEIEDAPRAAPGEEDVSPGEPAGSAGTDEPGPGPEAPGGPDGEPPVEPLSPEFHARVLAALQGVSDGDEALEGEAFDLLVEYVSRIGWDEVNRTADPLVADELHCGSNIANLSQETREAYSALWSKNRGRFAELDGKILKKEVKPFPDSAGGIRALQELWIVHQDTQVWIVYALDCDAKVTDEVVVKGAFYKYRKTPVANGGSGDFPVLVAKGTGSGARALPPDLARERKILDAVRDLIAEWRGPGLYYLLGKQQSLSDKEIAEAVQGGLLDLVYIPQKIDDRGINEETYRRILNSKRGVWRECRGQVLSVTGELRWTREAELPAGAVPGLSACHWGQIHEDESGRVITFAVAAKPDFPEKAKVTLRGAFYKMYRYLTKKDQPYNSPFVVGKALVSGYVHPNFAADQLDEYLASIEDQTAKIHTDSYYFLLWWLDRHEKREEIEEKADPKLGDKLYISKYTKLDEEELERFRDRWRENRGKPMTVIGRLVYLNEEEIPPGRGPLGYDRKIVFSGMLVTIDQHLFPFTTLERGRGVQVDEAVRVTGIFYKNWRYRNRKEQEDFTDSVYILGHEVVPLPKDTSREWMAPWVIALGSVIGLCTVAIVVMIFVERRGDRVARSRTIERKKQALQAQAGTKSPPVPESRDPSPPGELPGAGGTP